MWTRLGAMFRGHSIRSSKPRLNASSKQLRPKKVSVNLSDAELKTFQRKAVPQVPGSCFVSCAHNIQMLKQQRFGDVELSFDHAKLEQAAEQSGFGGDHAMQDAFSSDIRLAGFLSAQVLGHLERVNESIPAYSNFGVATQVFGASLFSIECLTRSQLRQELGKGNYLFGFVHGDTVEELSGYVRHALAIIGQEGDDLIVFDCSDNRAAKQQSNVYKLDISLFNNLRHLAIGIHSPLYRL